MGSRKCWLVISALVVAAAATSINRFDQDEFEGFDEETNGFDDYDHPESNNVTEHGGRKGKICKCPLCILLIFSVLFLFT